MYMRASLEYRIAYGDDATIRTALHATQRRRTGSLPASRAPAKYASGSDRIPRTPDSARTAPSLVPKTYIQPWSSR
jgi:hypothetical protein